MRPKGGLFEVARARLGVRDLRRGGGVDDARRSELARRVDDADRRIRVDEEAAGVRELDVYGQREDGLQRVRDDEGRLELDRAVLSLEVAHAPISLATCHLARIKAPSMMPSEMPHDL